MAAQLPPPPSEQPPQWNQPPAQSSSNTLSIISFPLAAIALLFVPILFGGAAIALAAVGKFSKKEKLGTVAFVVALVATVVGMVIGAIVGASATLETL
ncbi:hypothetical protein [Antribacter gilvus]|uniref:hypothetical protein n=1 Tax=Antribacter gilvus TaxID=2304675 RepID=UPI000F7A8817|nr:hypothetical protein [Antribacter gilvus]